MATDACLAGRPSSVVVVDTPHFTAREKDVLTALERGRSNRWIARQLNLSENTVKIHLRHITRKLKATNRTQAVIHFQRQRAPIAQASCSTLN